MERRKIMPNISVIIPVFNTEKYLSKCFDSIINLRDTEIIVVDDGSSDGSEAVINEYASKYVVYRDKKIMEYYLNNQ